MSESREPGDANDSDRPFWAGFLRNFDSASTRSQDGCDMNAMFLVRVPGKQPLSRDCAIAWLRVFVSAQPEARKTRLSRDIQPTPVSFQPGFPVDGRVTAGTGCCNRDILDSEWCVRSTVRERRPRLDRPPSSGCPEGEHGGANPPGFVS
jgi:hypothetical protein